MWKGWMGLGISRTLLSSAFLIIIIIYSATLPVLSSQYSSERISSFGEVDYSTTNAIFKNDFSNTLSDWSIESGVWAIEDGKLRGTASDNQRIMILYRGEVGKDYEINVKVYVISAIKFPEGQIIFRYKNTGNYYFAGIGVYGYKAAIGVKINGNASLIASGGELGAAKTGVWYNLRVKAVGSTLTVYVDGTEICSVVDTVYATGKVGLTVYSSSVYFDDFEIRKLSSTEQESIFRLHVEGTQIKDQFGRRVYLKGVGFNVDQWYYQGYGTEQQFIYMKNWGVNVVRLAIEASAIEQGVLNKPDFWAKLDDMIYWAEKHGIYIILDGQHNSGTDSQGRDRYKVDWWTAAMWNAWIERWKTYATRYKGRINILYDLLNEPLKVPSNEFYQTKMRQAIDAIRAIDPNVVIIVEEMSTSSWEGMGFSFEQTNPINRPNMLFSGHLYAYESGSTKEAIRSKMSAKKWDWTLQNNRAIWIGECGARQDDGFSLTEQTWVRNFLTILNEDGYAGFCAWRWATSGFHYVLADWNGSPNDYGKIVQEFL